MSARKKSENASPERQPGLSGGVSEHDEGAMPSQVVEVRQEAVQIPDDLPLLPLRGTVVFPGTVVSLGVGRPGSRALLDECLPNSKVIGLVTQRDEEVEEPDASDIYEVGVAGVVLKLVRQPDETVSIIVHGLSRVKFESVYAHGKSMRAKVRRLADQPGNGKKFEATVNQLREQARQLIDLSPNAPEQAQTVLMNIEDPSSLADFLAANLNIEPSQKQDLLEELDVSKRIRQVLLLVSNQLETLKLQAKIQADVQDSIGKTQHRMFLREQMKAIQRELGEDDDPNAATVAELRKRIEEAEPPEAVMKEAERDLARLESIHPASPEYSVILSYLELVAELPWNRASEEHLDLKHARRILDRDHFDLEKVKRRLIEYLAVRKLNPEGRGPILCLVGPPGVGKTSLGQSVADALGREFARLSLGGIRDEAEIRGHRRTYIGAMPGRIIQEIRRAGTNNPVMMLDEVDKLGADFRGDPASALLEVLDPRQNHAFVDRYLDVAFDLSQVLFIATANYMGTVPPALADRMEVIEIPGYTDYDKMQIARRYLVPRQLKENGLKRSRCRWSAKAIRKLINDYTREAGVRELERRIGAVCRHVAAEVAELPEASQKSWKVEEKLVTDALGPEQYFREVDVRTRTPGVVCALAYTPTGGELLFIEATAYPGKGKVLLTGKLGEIMKESADAALSLFKTASRRYGYDVAQLAERDIHIHVPAGAVAKDGPSAGVGMYTAIASLLLDVSVKKRVAMTGELTLRGLVLPVGGIKEKTLAAERAGIRTVILPEKNRRDMPEVDETVRKKLRFEFVEHVDEALELALGRDPLKRAVKRASRGTKKAAPAGA